MMIATYPVPYTSQNFIILPLRGAIHFLSPWTWTWNDHVTAPMTGSRERDASWLLWPGHKKGCSLVPIPLLGCSSLTPSHHVVRKPNHRRRPHIGVLASSSNQRLASTTTPESKWAQSLSFLAQLPDIVEQRKAFLCPIHICKLTDSVRVINSCFVLLCLGRNCN